MGFDEGRIVLESPNGTYYPGQTVIGKLIFRQEKEKTFRGIYAKLKGFCKVHWTTQESYTVNGKTQTRTVSHDSYEEYANAKVYLAGGESGEHQLQPGNYEYPFSFHLPLNCPSSFEGSYGHVRYQIKTVVDRAFKLDQEKKVAVRIYNLLDLNRDPSCREPIEMEFNATYCCCCMGSGATNTVINVPVSGYCPGQNIPIEINCSNNGTVDVDGIKLSVVKKIKFIATSNPDERSEKDTIAKITKGPVPANTSRNYTVEMAVPALDVYNLNDCRYIDMSYKFKVVVNPSGCHSDSEGSQNIIIGNIPLVGFQDNVQNPLQDQMPQHMVAVTQQPLSSYSANQTYPPSITPYPGGNAPYPASNSPYPAGAASYPVSSPYLSDQSKSPYPITNAPYPTNDFKVPYLADNISNFDNPPPYPGNTLQKSPNLTDNLSYSLEKSPYPSGNPPYPVENSPNPAGNSPYPARNTPYPAGNSPCPAGNTPYPAGNTPHPAGNTPYPAGNTPYPAGNTPYPAGNTPYPTGNSPCPAGNTPYPAGNSPYPAEKIPYPAGNTPYPTGNSPCPAGNTPYPTGNSPYPAENTPCPTGNSPYPTGAQPVPGSGLNSLRTGTLGFRVPGNSSAPFSPNVGMPSPMPVYPYASASAPPADSPVERKD